MSRTSPKKTLQAWISEVVFMLLSLAGMTACTAAATPSPLPNALPALTTTPMPSPTMTVSPEPTPLPTIDLHPKMVVLAENLPSPDDLVLAPDGSLYLSDISDGTVKRLASDGSLQTIISGLSKPEGMVFLPDGSLVIAEQGRNRLVRFDPAASMLTPFLDLTNDTGQAGLDGLALDASLPQSPSLLVPDSPNGTLLRVSLDGKTVTKIIGGLARPTGAWAESNGSILVVDENTMALSRIRTDGTLEKVAILPIPDDVVADGQGNIFVNTLGDGAIHRIDAASGQDTLLAGGLLDPQGLILTADGNLIVAEAGRHRLIKLVLR
jgi:streptogramin lyase